MSDIVYCKDCTYAEPNNLDAYHAVKFGVFCTRYKQNTIGIYGCDNGKQKAKTNADRIRELKAEASKLGYKLIPIKKMPKKLPCVCGCNRRTKWWAKDGLFFECNNCHRKSPVGKSEFDAVNKLNEMIGAEDGKGINVSTNEDYGT